MRAICDQTSVGLRHEGARTGGASACVPRMLVAHAPDTWKARLQPSLSLTGSDSLQPSAEVVQALAACNWQTNRHNLRETSFRACTDSSSHMHHSPTTSWPRIPTKTQGTRWSQEGTSSHRIRACSVRFAAKGARLASCSFGSIYKFLPCHVFSRLGGAAILFGRGDLFYH